MFPTDHKKKYPYQNRSLEDMEGEEWKLIPGYGNKTYISNRGRVKSIAHPLTGKIKAQRLYTKGELLLSFRIAFKDREYEFRTAAVVYQVFIGELDFKLFNIAYKDGNSLNLYPDNLIAFKRYKQIEQERKYHKQQLIAATASMYKYPYQNLSLVDMDGEIWKPLPELPDYYAVSNKGRVKSLERKCKARDGGIRTNKPQIAKQRVQTLSNPITNEAYQHLSIHTSVDYKKCEYTVSRLVYEAFVAPLGKENMKVVVRHKDENHFNNTPGNLYMSTLSELQNELVKTGKRNRLSGCSDLSRFTQEDWEARYDSIRRPVSQFDMDGNFIRSFESVRIAAENIAVKQSATISSAIAGRIKTAGGYQWRAGIDQSPMKPLKIKQHLKKAFQAKKVAEYDLNGTLLEVYLSATMAARKNKINPSLLYGWLSRPHRTPRGGKKFIWKYV